jgi:DNA-binding CsgD family transcriptional regulator
MGFLCQKKGNNCEATTMPRNKTGKAAILTLERRRQAVDLRRKGKSYNEIADIMGLNKSSIHKTVSKALKELKDDLEADATLLRAQELDRLDSLQSACWPDAMEGNTTAGAQILRVMERRAKLLGLDEAQSESTSGPKGGVMLVPAMVDADTWGEAARKSQEDLKKKVRD